MSWARWPLWLPRLYLGVIFAVAAFGKLRQGASFAGTLQGFFAHVALQDGFVFYRWLVATVLLPHVAIVAGFVVVAEVYIAVAMLSGFTLRIASVVAIALLANYLCAKGMPPVAPASNDAADIVLALVVFGVAQAGFAKATYPSRASRSAVL